MKKNTEEKSLIVYKENNIFNKIISFLKNLFSTKNDEHIIKNPSTINNTINTKNDFLEKLKVIDDELEKLKQDIKNKKISIIDLAEEQIDNLQKYYDKQIENDKIRLNELKRKLAYLTS